MNNQHFDDAEGTTQLSRDLLEFLLARDGSVIEKMAALTHATTDYALANNIRRPKLVQIFNTVLDETEPTHHTTRVLNDIRGIMFPK